MTVIDIISPEIYSIRAWPYGCPASAGFPDILKLISVTMADPESDRLLTASAIMDMLPARTPAVIFTAHSNRLVTIPVMPDSFPYASRTLGSDVSL